MLPSVVATSAQIYFSLLGLQRLAEAFPEHAEANAKVAAIRDLAQHIEQLRQEKARVSCMDLNNADTSRL